MKWDTAHWLGNSLDKGAGNGVMGATPDGADVVVTPPNHAPLIGHDQRVVTPDPPDAAISLKNETLMGGIMGYRSTRSNPFIKSVTC